MIHRAMVHARHPWVVRVLATGETWACKQEQQDS